MENNKCCAQFKNHFSAAKRQLMTVLHYAHEAYVKRDREGFLNSERSRKMTEATASYTRLWSIGNHLSLPLRLKLCETGAPLRTIKHTHTSIIIYIFSLVAVVSLVLLGWIHDFTSRTASRLDGRREISKMHWRTCWNDCWKFSNADLYIQRRSVHLQEYLPLRLKNSDQYKRIQNNCATVFGGRANCDTLLSTYFTFIRFTPHSASVLLFIYRTIYNRQTSTKHKQKPKAKLVSF